MADIKFCRIFNAYKNLYPTFYDKKKEGKQMSNINRAIIIVLDGFGVGQAPDADKYGDVGSRATLSGIIKLCYECY